MSDTAAAAASDKNTQREVNRILGPETLALLARIDERRRLEAERGIRNWLLAPTLAVYHAMQRGEAVPLSELRPEIVRLYGLRRRT